MVPRPEKKEWRYLLEGKLNPFLTSHLLKIKLNTLRQKIRHKMISLEDAVKDLHHDCELHEDIYMKDLHKIFTQERQNVF